MYAFLCKRLFQNVKSVRNQTQIQLGFLQTTITSPTKSFSSSSPSSPSSPSSSVAAAAAVKDGQQQSFTVTYLMNSCGLSLENAIPAYKRVHFETPHKPDSILKLFKDHGFTNAQITKIVRIRPEFLTANPEKTILPKLEFLRSIGLSDIVIRKIIYAVPSILSHSLDNHLIPTYEFIKANVDVDEKVGIALKSCPRILNENVQKRLAPNIATLKDHGVPASSISFLFTHNGAMLVEKCDKLEQYAKEIIGKGFDPSAVVFVVALHVIGTTTESTWNRKIEVYRRWGWSETEFQAAFRSNPTIMHLSEEKITCVMEFLVNKMGLKSAVIARNPSVLGCSLEKRIIPRCSVIEVLLLKELIKKDLGLSSYLFPKEDVFLKRFVNKYVGDAPELLSVYRGKMRNFELNQL